MVEPGLNRHEWETEWAALEPLVVDSPAEALPELDRLVRGMLVERGYPLEEGEIERTAEEGIDPEVLAGYRAGHEIATRVDGGEDVDPAEVGQAVGLFRELYEHLLARRGAGALAAAGRAVAAPERTGRAATAERRARSFTWRRIQAGPFPGRFQRR